MDAGDSINRFDDLARILFRSDDGQFSAGVFRQSSANETLRIAGELGQLEEGDSVRLIGQFKVDDVGGGSVTASYPIMPHTKEGLIGSLRWPSRVSGPVERLVACFGVETLSIITDAPNGSPRSMNWAKALSRFPVIRGQFFIEMP